MEKFKDYIKNKTGAATTEAEMEKLKKEYLKKTSGVAVTESALNNLEKSIREMGSKASSIPGVGGAAVSENEMERLKNIKGNKKGGMTKGQKKIRTVMKEFKEKKLKSSSGQKVKNPKQAIAIALSEAGQSKKPKKAAMGAFIVKGGDYIKDLL